MQRDLHVNDLTHGALLPFQASKSCWHYAPPMQIWVGYFFVMVVRWRTDVAERRRFATARGLHRAAASLSELQEGAVQHSLLWAYLLGVVTWQALLAVLHSWH